MKTPLLKTIAVAAIPVLPTAAQPNDLTEAYAVWAEGCYNDVLEKGSYARTVTYDCVALNRWLPKFRLLEEEDASGLDKKSKSELMRGISFTKRIDELIQ